MKDGIQIDRKTGDVVVGDQIVFSRIKPSDLTYPFHLGAEMPVRVLRETIPCMFATAIVGDSARKVKVELRFERSVLVSIFFELLDAEDRYPDSNSYYEGQAERYREHLEWLQQKLDSGPASHTQYKWGLVGVAKGKGGEVYIFIHNQNNSLVCHGDRA